LQTERERLYEQFRSGARSGLILSRVGNFALDLPDADVLIQVSGKYGVVKKLSASRAAP